MAYVRNQPIAGDDLDISQPKLVTNTNGADDSFGVDHFQFSDTSANNGFHKKVTLAQVAADPAQAFPEALVYTKNLGITPNRLTELFFSSKPETGADIVKQLTGDLTTQSVNGGTAGGSIFRTVTPWGLTIYSGQTNAFNSNSKTVVFPVSLNVIWGSSAVSNSVSSGGTLNLVTCIQSNAGLNLGNTANFAVNWIAIGAT